jgi:hypothetical protein
MMKTLFYIPVAISMMLMATSCIGGGSPVPDANFIYLTGDTSRTVQISYLEIEHVKNNSRDKSYNGSPAPEYYDGDKNIIITERVTLPFFKEAHVLSTSVEFLEVASENDSTTKAIIFGRELSVLRADGSECWNIAGNLSNNKILYPDSPTTCGDCMLCKGLTPDSIMSYLKAVNYNGYLEFSQGDARKRVRRWK